MYSILIWWVVPELQLIKCALLHRYNDISTKANHGDIFIIHDQKSIAHPYHQAEITDRGHRTSKGTPLCTPLVITITNESPSASPQSFGGLFGPTINVASKTPQSTTLTQCSGLSS